MRHNLDALDEYNFLKDELLDELEEIKQSAEKRMDDIASKVENRQNEFGYIVLKSQALKAAMLQHFTHLESAANTLLKVYRDENRKHRSIKDSAPGRFDAPWIYERPTLQGEIILDPSGTDLADALRKALEEAPRQREQLHTAYRNALAEYRRIDELVA